MDGHQLAVVIVGGHGKALRAAGAEAVSAQLLVGQNIAADTVFKLQHEIESILGTVVAVAVQQRGGAALDLDLDGVILTHLCQAQIGGALIIGHRVIILTPVEVLHLLHALGDEIDIGAAARLDEGLLLHGEHQVALRASVISAVGHGAFGHDVLPDAKALAHAVEAGHPEAGHLPVTAAGGQGNAQTGEMFHHGELHHEANSGLGIDLADIGEILSGCGPVSVKFSCAAADTVFAAAPGCAGHVHIAQLHQNIVGNPQNLGGLRDQLDQVLLRIGHGHQCRAPLIGMHGSVVGASGGHRLALSRGCRVVEQRVGCEEIFGPAGGSLFCGYACAHGGGRVNADAS